MMMKGQLMSNKTTKQQDEIMEQINKDVSQSKKQIQYKQDVQEAKVWLRRELNQGLIPSCLHNPHILHHLDDNADLHSIDTVAHALVDVERFEEEEYNFGD